MTNGNNTLSYRYNWDVTTSQWVAGLKQTYYYSEHNITFLPKIPEQQISVYPNPAKEFICI